MVGEPRSQADTRAIITHVQTRQIAAMRLIAQQRTLNRHHINKLYAFAQDRLNSLKAGPLAKDKN